MKKAEMTTTNTTTELAPTSLPTNLLGAEIRPDSSNLLPQIKMVWPIEIGPDSAFTKNDSFTLGLYDGDTFKQLPAGWICSVIASRNMARFLTENEEGDKVYQRAYSKLGEMSRSAAKYGEMVAKHAAGDKTVQTGYSFVVAVISGKDVAIAAVEACGIQADYLGRPMSRHAIVEKIGLKINIDDHTTNLKTSKADKTRQYLDPKKFVQHETVKLTEDQVERIAQAFEANHDRFLTWLNQ